MGKVQFSMSKWKKNVQLATETQDKKKRKENNKEILKKKHSTVVQN